MMKQHLNFRCTHYASNEGHIGEGHVNSSIYIGEYDQTIGNVKRGIIRPLTW
jgi:hypothetical protein